MSRVKPRPTQKSIRGGLPSRMINATICAAVFHLPSCDTATWARAPSSAIHSRRADTTISRPMMIMAGRVSHRLLCSSTSRTSATTTISLSATGSRKAPNGVLCPRRRAR
ncbi:hypothetical protein D3C78_1549760 [compost metagenome]